MADNFTKWAPIAGQWEFDDSAATYVGTEQRSAPLAHGILLSPFRLRSGSIAVQVSLADTQNGAARALFGYGSQTASYFSLGLGGHGYAYVLSQYVPNRGWQALQAAGSNSNLKSGISYKLQLRLQGQKVSLAVDDVKVLDDALPYPLLGDQVGLFAWGQEQVRFEGFERQGVKARAFVVMQFGQPYDSLYSDVIKPVSEAAGLDVQRANEEYRPGIVLQDIVRRIREADVIIADITPPNPNVFYELGFSHAMDKPTILLAQRGAQLPFDIGGFRCIFYDNSIGGKSDVETTLKQHLSNILNGG